MNGSTGPVKTHDNSEMDSDRSSSKPKKFIISNTHLQAFISSATHAEVVGFIENLNNSIIGLPLDHPVLVSPNVTDLLQVLERIKEIAHSHPPVDNKASRFGNPGFREFYDHLDQESEKLHGSLDIPEEKRAELSTYLTESWGDRTRIDYGSGTEFNFLCWLLCLKKLDVLGPEDYPAVVLKVFWKYFEVMRYLQSTYGLEPAASHGVEGLDNYHFLPFLFGAGQLTNHKHLKPASIHDPDFLKGFSNQYMYLACIQSINSTANVRRHSSMLDDASGFITWDAVNLEMIKIYRSEVLAKLAVAQHFLFGTLLPVPNVDLRQISSKAEELLVVDHDGHLSQRVQGSPSTSKKSRFAQRRAAELHSTKSLDDGLSVPTGRFELDLGLEDNDQQNPLHNGNTDSRGPPPLMTEIVERCSNTINVPNNNFDPKFCADATLISKAPASNNPKSLIPPWELRRLASRHTSLNSQQASVDNPGVPVLQSQQSLDRAPSGGPSNEPFTVTDKDQISAENQALLSQMSPDEILQEQAAVKARLMQSNPELLTKLLKKFNIEVPAPRVPSDDPIPPSPISKRQKHVRYAEDTKLPLDPSPLSEEIGSCAPSRDHKINPDSLSDPLEPRPLKFDWNGVRVVNNEDSHHSVDNASDENIHVHNTSTYTVRQLLRLILSSVPSQRTMGFKIFTQIMVRYFENSTHGLDETDLAVLTEELNGASLEILTITSQATRERNLGVATSALTLMGTVLSKASSARTGSSRHKCIVQPDWIEELITQTTLLADFHLQLQHQELPRLSLTCMVQILRDLIILGDSSKVSEEIIKRPSFLELIIQVLVSVPWPLSSQSKPELPDLSVLELLLELARSSRSGSQSMLARGLLTPMLRFIALPYWSLPGTSDSVTEGPTPVPKDHIMNVLIYSMCYQFQLISVFAGYGLGANLRTTLDPLLRTTTLGLHKILNNAVSGCSSAVPPGQAAGEFALISAFLKLLQSWMRCADDPHFCDPPHSITWSQVTEWESSVVDFLRLASTPSSRSPGLDEVLACACGSLALYIRKSNHKKINITSSLASLDSLMPQLESLFQTAAMKLVDISYANFQLQSGSSQCKLLINFAKLKTCVSKSSSPAASSSFQYDFPDETFALACRLGFECEGLSLLPWALSVLCPSCDTASDVERILLAGLLVRNSDGTIVNDLLAETFRRCESRANLEWESVVRPQTQTIDLSRLLPIFKDYLDQAAPYTQISDPSPQQLQNQMSQNEPPAFLFTSTWPLLAIAFLKSEHLTSATPTSQIRPSDIVRASLTMAIVMQSSLCNMQARFESLSNILRALLLDRLSVWKSVVTAVLATTSQIYHLESQNTEKPMESIFEDEACSQLMTRLIDISPRRARRSQINKSKLRNTPEIFKVQQSEDEELFTTFTGILAGLDSGSLENAWLMRILLPFLSMRRGREFRGKLFSDHGDILLNMKVRLQDVMSLEDSDDANRGDRDEEQLQEYLYPLEHHAQMLHLFAEFLANHSTRMNAQEYPFLFLYLIHHLSSQIWSPDRDERLRLDLLKVILSRAKSDDICWAILRYDHSSRLEKQAHSRSSSSSRCLLPPSLENHSDDLERGGSQTLERVHIFVNSARLNGTFLGGQPNYSSYIPQHA
ncbi:hypothetical protein PCASD_07942 [Puccinia coronata f. sp. avenae]|uniref:peptidylprolyl isomerase n=1 Tax=Puccinia coronata f. sp. avenae TaxID=200324 RepID=A0A2N5UTE4_9BASI|nr:hypothetical protein PCASD_07942 [Puccinia coronata f. sp. avenae]